MNKIFNTTFEVSLRILIILYCVGHRFSLERIIAYDFIALYGKEFGISDRNIQGNNDYKFSEFASRRKISNEALRELILRGYANVCFSKQGMKYQVTRKGIEFCEQLNDNYADNLKKYIKNVHMTFSRENERKLMLMINKSAIDMFGGRK